MDSLLLVVVMLLVLGWVARKNRRLIVSLRNKSIQTLDNFGIMIQRVENARASMNEWIADGLLPFIEELERADYVRFIRLT